MEAVKYYIRKLMPIITAVSLLLSGGLSYVTNDMSEKYRLSIQFGDGVLKSLEVYVSNNERECN